MSSLKVSIWDQTVGYLVWDAKNNRSIFELDQSYQKSACDIAPILLNKKLKIHTSAIYEPIFQGLMPAFADSLPDSFGNRVFQAWLEQNALEFSDLNPIERLLYTGKRGIGALEYEPGKVIINTIDTVDFQEIVDISEKIIFNKYHFSDYMANQNALQNILTIGSSVGGAQAKILVAIHPKTGEVKPGDVVHRDPDFEYFIIKLGHKSDSQWGYEKTSVEYVYYLMAKAAGLSIYESKLIEDSGNIHFQTKRFDRSHGEKIHFQTLLAITGYFNKSQPFSYERCFEVLEQLQIKHTDKELFFRQMVFNVAACNQDDHMKNVGFLYNRQNEWSLAPAYDLTYPFDPYSPSLKFHKMSVNGKSKNIDREDVLQLGKRVGIRDCAAVINEVCDAVAEFKTLAKNYAISDFAVEAIGKDIAASVGRLYLDVR